MSSLVFVIILAVWAVYLVQHWVRRRDHLATARSVDRFSEAMRVLERRRVLTAPAEDAPRSYAASPLRPARPGRPEVVVKQRPAGATAVGPSREHRRARLGARARALVLLTGSLTMVVLAGLAVARVLPPWSALVGVAACALAVGGVRWSVARQSAGRRAASAPVARRRPVAAPATTRTRQGQGHEHAPAAPEDHHQFAAQTAAVALRAGSSRSRLGELYDIAEVEGALATAEADIPEAAPSAPAAELAATATEPAEGTWQPVPVPPPTYTFKAKAYRGVATAPSAGLGAGLPASLPEDGIQMALDEEFEDLPRIDRVG